MYLTILLIAVTCFISYRGIKNEFFLDQYSFNIEKVMIYKQYYRLVTSGFFHVNWLHLIINAFVLWSFGSGMEVAEGIPRYLVIFFTSLIGGNLLALLIHKHNESYSSVGASGAISGLIFASIALYPTLNIFFLPGWVFGIAYVLYTIYAIRSQRTDVGHAAHLGGALIGMTFALMMHPSALVNNWLPILAILVPGVALILIMLYKPEIILVDKSDQVKQLTVDDRYNLSKFNEKQEVDRILEKINQKGMSSLTKKEKALLEEYSKR
jgi:membrane associated rhomboid family serine protease